MKSFQKEQSHIKRTKTHSSIMLFHRKNAFRILREFIFSQSGPHKVKLAIKCEDRIKTIQTSKK